MGNPAFAAKRRPSPDDTLITTIREHTFFRGPLESPSYVLDLGANRGDFSRGVTERFEVTCIAVEPTEELASGIAGERIRVRQAAITAEPGEVVLYVSDNPEASSLTVGGPDAVSTESVPGIPLKELLDEEQVEAVALVKVDIEGAERDMFMTADDQTLQRVAQFTVEFHVFTGALTDADVKAIRDRLKGLGFEGIRFSAGHHNWLFFQPSRCGVGRAEIFFTRRLLRWLRGAAVRAARLVRLSAFEGN